jgi:hypothetical protein
VFALMAAKPKPDGIALFCIRCEQDDDINAKDVSDNADVVVIKLKLKRYVNSSKFSNPDRSSPVHPFSSFFANAQTRQNSFDGGISALVAGTYFGMARETL